VPVPGRPAEAPAGLDAIAAPAPARTRGAAIVNRPPRRNPARVPSEAWCAGERRRRALPDSPSTFPSPTRTPETSPQFKGAGGPGPGIAAGENPGIPRLRSWKSDNQGRPELQGFVPADFGVRVGIARRTRPRDAPGLIAAAGPGFAKRGVVETPRLRRAAHPLVKPPLKERRHRERRPAARPTNRSRWGGPWRRCESSGPAGAGDKGCNYRRVRRYLRRRGSRR
jgi:hypothetical protein